MTFTQYSKIFLNALLAGLFIGMAGTVYLAVPNANLGAFLFAFALMTILCYGFKLFTGAIGYLMTQKRADIFSYLITLILIWLGNLGGCFAVGSLVRSTRTFALIEARVMSVCNAKLNDDPASLLILAFFCGILMYLAVDTFKRDLPPVIRMTNVFLCVMVFIISGFEHCIANMYYFSVAGMWSWNNLALVLWMTLGNALGGMFPVIADKVRN